MIITYDIVNNYFKKCLSVPDVNFLSVEGFTILADWCERQSWWETFVCLHEFKTNWRVADSRNDPYLFALTVFRFLVKKSFC